MNREIKPSEEQLAYATILDWGMKIGLIGIIITFVIYLFGIFPAYIPVEELPRYWKLNVHNYLEVTGIQSGWTWLKLISKGDFLNFLPIAFLAGLTILCYIRILPIFIKKKDTPYVILTLLQILILLLAASGILKVGAH
jgi:phosphoglycerol transferase MdoB-like AlkP superfamily enzyme